MACPEVFVNMARYTQSFLEELRLLPSPPPTLSSWIPRGTFPAGRGMVQTTFQIGRQMPVTDTPEFEVIETTTPNICTDVYNDVGTGFNAMNFRPEKFSWRGDPICADNLYFDFERERFLNRYMVQMRKFVDWTIENRFAAIFDHYVPKAVAQAQMEFTASPTGYPGQSPDLSALPHVYCQLQQQMLDQVAVELTEIGANMGAFSDNWINYGPAGPEWVAQIGLAASRNLLVQSGEQRTDFRYAEMGAGPEDSEILKRVGASRLIGNFRHLVIETPPRYNWVDGTGLVRVNTWIPDPATTSGISMILNPEWKSADYEGLRVLSRSVFQSLIIPPIMSSGANTKFGPRSYMGDWQFVAGAYKWATDCVDPLEKIGRHFANYYHGPEPLRPETGRLIIFRRCPGEAECIPCSPGAS